MLKQKLMGVVEAALLITVGFLLGRMHGEGTKVQAQERFSGITNCVTVVPQSWGQFKGGRLWACVPGRQGGCALCVASDVR